jgi:PelA/Pel-15E family pectate lyase
MSNSRPPLLAFLLAILCLQLTLHSQADYGMAFGQQVARLTNQPDDWFKSDKGKQTVDNIVTWQNPNGGWWKAYDASNPRPTTMPAREGTGPRGDDDNVWHDVSTIDNSATYSEARIVARAYRVLKDQKCKDSFDKSLKYLWSAQYPNGGWPQRFPLQNNYGRHITFNDDAMLGVMRLMRDVAAGKGDFEFVSEADRKRATESFDRGIDCILACQIKQNGKPTIWCQQHDAQTLLPANARAYELPSFAASESAGLVMLLMELPQPDEKVKAAVEGAVDWYEAHKITGKRIERVTGDQYDGGRDVKVVDDPTAPRLWARFYDLETHKPFFSGRDGIKKASLDQIEPERRRGYSWYGGWGEKVLKEYPKWKQRVGG